MCSHELAPRPVALEVLEREITQLASEIHAATCRWLGLVAQFDRREGWAAWGCRSCAHWVSWRCGIALVAAREHVRVARRLEQLPLIRQAFAEGCLSYSKARALTRVEGIVRESELLELARHATASQLERLVRAYRGVVAVEHAARGAGPERWLTWSHDEDGSLLLRGRLPAEEGALLVAALEAASASVAVRGDGAGAGASAEASPAEAGAGDAARPGVSAYAPASAAERGDGAGAGASAEASPAEAGAGDAARPGASANVPAFDAERGDGAGMGASAEAPRVNAAEAHADALLLMADSFLAHGAADRAGGDRHQVVIHVDAAMLQSRPRSRDGRCELDTGAPVAAETIRRLACDAAIVPLLERAGQPLGIGRKTRSIPPALRRALAARDGGCRFPGCGNRRFVDAHHIHHWTDGGPTELDNLVHLCRRHHRLLHEGGYRLTAERHGRLTFRRPDGCIIPACPAPPPAHPGGLCRRRAGEPPPVAAEACVPLSGDRLDLDLGVHALLTFAPPVAMPPGI